MMNLEDRIGLGPSFIEGIYARYLESPSSVDDEWRHYFKKMENGSSPLSLGPGGPSWARRDWPPEPNDDLSCALMPGVGGKTEQKPSLPMVAVQTTAEMNSSTLDSIRALMMIRAYRVRGHLIAKLDPLGLNEPEPHPELDPETYGFGPEDRDRQIFIDNVLGLETASINDILEILHRTYCAHLGVEFMHINEPEEKAWIQKRIEGRDKEIHFTPEGKKAILSKLVEAERFELFLGKKYTGTKRFGLDGGETAIPALEAIIKTAGALGIEEIVLGMSHRGRLNVLANVMRKPYRAIFNEFDGGSANPDDVQGSGDVKYHLGTSSDREFDGNNVHLSLTANPSHLEAVDPVVLGKVRAKQTLRGDREHGQVMALLLHGDAAFAGQGLVAECFMLSNLTGYRTGGTVHFVVNNQIGFTTSPHHLRSSQYPSDVAKMVQAPIFHANADDPESVVYAAKVATEFRQKFKKDVVVDMICYRRFGHNEIDDPSFTQPKMYRVIKEHPSSAEIYRDKLKAEGLISDADYGRIVADYDECFEQELKSSKSYKPNKADWFEGQWAGLSTAKGKAWRAPTGVDQNKLDVIGEALVSYPDDFDIHKTLKRILAQKKEALASGMAIDWALAESLAFGSLLMEDYPIRFSGQDSIRGTFSQRHAEIVDQTSGDRFRFLSQLEGANFEIIDSPLSEAGVLGFEYGYALAEPRTLVIWEAQFGDFANGAQVIIDQFISSGEAKWLRMCGLVLLLPHGYEGQGAEHSSARLERFLQLCAERNMQVANCSTPASYFHILRRQMHRNFRKPLIIVTPKSLLRHKLATSPMKDMIAKTQFHRVLWDEAQSNPTGPMKLKNDNGIKRVILCSGKVYYDLMEARDKGGLSDQYILRLEQLYPFPEEALMDELSRFRKAGTIVWCQEEPKNMGAWSFAEPRLAKLLAEMGLNFGTILYAGRAESAAVATGRASVHVLEQKELVQAALGISDRAGAEK